MSKISKIIGYCCALHWDFCQSYMSQVLYTLLITFSLFWPKKVHFKVKFDWFLTLCKSTLQCNAETLNFCLFCPRKTHCRKRQCWNVVVDTFGPDDTIWPKAKKVQYWFLIFIVLGIYYFVFHWDCCVIHSNFMWNIATNFPFAYNIKS